MNQSLRRLIDTWRALPMARRVVLTGLAGGVIAAAVLLYSWSSSTNYVPLYSGLEPEDSGRIVDQLRSRGVGFKLEQSGATVLVPQSEVDELRVTFATQGLPQGGNVGFELVKGNGFTATDFVQRLNFQRGLQGELARTIESFSAVERARVHIVLPEKALFVKDQRPPSASVVLKMRGGQQLDSREVRGIAHLVTGAVEGLKQEHVTIVDTSGAMLFDGSQLAAEGGGFAASGSQMELQRAYEQNLESDVQQLLDRALGPGRAAVKVRATLNFDRLETMTESYAPGGSAGNVQRSQTSVQESYKTNGSGAAGAVPGAVANVPGANQAVGAGTTAGANGTDYTRSETTTNFEVGKTLTKNVQAVGGVKKVSVSLLLDEQVPEAQVQPLQAAVSAAVGFDQQRGDTVAVSRFAFDRSQIEEAEQAFESAASRDQLFGYARMALPVLALVLGFVLFKLLMRSVGKRVSYRVTELQPALADGRAMAALGAPAMRALPAPMEEVRSDMEQRVSELVSSQPQRVADVMQAWLREEG